MHPNSKRSFPLPSTVSALSLLALLSAPVLSLSGCSASQAEPKAAPPAIPVEVTQLAPSTLHDTSDYVATLKSRESVTLQPQVSGQVVKIWVRPGDRVAAGTPLLLIDSSKQQAAVSAMSAARETASADVSNAREQLRQYQAQREALLSELAYSQKQYDRFMKLRENSAVSDQDMDAQSNRYKKAMSDVQALDAQIKAQRASIAHAEKSVAYSQANIRQQQAELKYYTIRAPFSGTVGDVPVKIGDYVSPGTLLTSVSDISKLEVYLNIPSEKTGNLKKGGIIRLLSLNEEALGEGRIFFISPRVDIDSQTVLIKASFDNRDEKLRADQLVTARLILNAHSGVLVPTQAVQRMGDKTFIYVAQRDSKADKLIATLKPVQLGEIEGNRYAVLDGLQPGDVIVTSGAQKLSDGAAIQPKS